MTKQHAIIAVPGLGDPVQVMRLVLSHWKQSGYYIDVHPMPWNDKRPYEPKMKALLSRIDTLHTRYTVSVIGSSAGGVAAFDALVRRPDQINKAINVCGRIRQGITTGIRGFDTRTSVSPSFQEAVLSFEKKEHKIPVHLKKRIMSVRAFRGIDELVPGDTVYIAGAHNCDVPMVGHLLAIGFALGPLFSPVLMNFIHDTK